MVSALFCWADGFHVGVAGTGERETRSALTVRSLGGGVEHLS